MTFKVTENQYGRLS